MSDAKHTVTEAAQTLTHQATVTTSAVGGLYSLWVENPIGFICAGIAAASFLMNWYYKHKDERRKQERHEQGEK